MYNTRTSINVLLLSYQTRVSIRGVINLVNDTQITNALFSMYYTGLVTFSLRYTVQSKTVLYLKSSRLSDDVGGVIRPPTRVLTRVTAMRHGDSVRDCPRLSSGLRLNARHDRSPPPQWQLP